jgi:predicted AlkP superfamily phosphohydrolase/phosphomutase
MKNSTHEIFKSEFLLAGFIAGILYFILNLLLFFPSEQLSLMDSAFLKINLFVYSFCIWVVTFMFLSGMLHLLTNPLSLGPPNRVLPVLRRFIVYFIITLIFFAGHTVWKHYEHLPLSRNVKVENIKSLLYGMSIMVFIFSLGLSLIWSWAFSKMSHLRLPKVKQLLLVSFVCIVYIASVNLPFDLGEPTQAHPDKPRIVLLGVDAGSWNVLLPFIKNGDLPTFKKLLQTGSYGYLDTYGIKFTPVSFANIATGKKPEKHSVSEFFDVSSDWKAAPIWSIMSSAGKRVSVIHWPAAEPYFKVNGMFVSSLLSSDERTVYFSADLNSYKDTAMKILGSWEYQEVATKSDKVISRIMPDLIVFNYYPTDSVQHFFWQDMAPEQFSEGIWEGEQSDAAFKDTIRNTWIMVDGFISKLLETYGEDTYYFIISDHGARPVEKREVNLDMNNLLEQLGYLKKNNGKLDRESSTCYVAGKSSGFIDLKINPSKYTTIGKIDFNQYQEIRSRIADDLRTIVLKDPRKSIFKKIKIPDGPGTGNEPDITALPADVEMPEKKRMASLGSKEVPARILFKYHPWSGRHRPRGIILAKGPSIKHKYTGAWTIDEPYTKIFRHARGIFNALDRFTPVLQGLHIVDGITTLDITPTLLHIAGMPIAEDMDGRIVSELIDETSLDSDSITTIPTYHLGKELNIIDDSAENQRRKKLEERLKALGYMQ